jgi:hypothetical protein
VDAFSGQAQISSDGQHVAWTANADNLDPADADQTADAYTRNLASNVTQLVARANGATGVKTNGGSSIYALSSDGRYVTFGTTGNNLDPADPDTNGDWYVRDLQAATTTLVDRATGAGGAKDNGSDRNLSLSGDGRFAAWHTTGNNLSPDDTDANNDIYVRDLQTFVTSLESRGTPGHARPKGAAPLRASLVPAYSPCTAPDRTHGPPLAFPSCANPLQASPNLTVGTPDVNGATANSVGFVLFDASFGDMRISASLSDVRCAAALATCGSANSVAGPDYVGELRARVGVRRTDKFDSTGDNVSSTMGDSTLEFNFGCTATGTNVGATCSINTTANALVPGYLRFGDRTAMELGAVQLLDGGPDGDADTADNSLFATQGVFVP